MEMIEQYGFFSKKIPITIKIYKKEGEYVPCYDVSIQLISQTTKLILERIRQELINEVNLGMIEITETKKQQVVEEKFSNAIYFLVRKYFPNVDEKIYDLLTSYLIQKSLGLGEVEILMDDSLLEEIAINCANEPIWVFHRKHGWLKTNITPTNEDQIKHWASTIGRKVGRQITVLEPLLDATLRKGDRVNATLNPISTKGHTITIRKTSTKPIIITDMIKSKTIDLESAAFIWLAIQYEMSTLVSGGTASGKTSMLNCCACFFPPNQRIISIEDTRELMLPSYAHWVPMLTKLPNAEGKGEISMIDLLVNSLRQRPDRIIVGEIRRKREAEVLFEAIHTGHSVYATVHANNAQETITRLTNPPIDIPKMMLPAISMIVNQYRNRRTGKRRTFEIAEILENGEINVLRKYEPLSDKHVRVNNSKTILNTLTMYTGMTAQDLGNDIAEKMQILQYLVDQGYDDVESLGRVMAEYYTNKDNLMKYVKVKKKFEVIVAQQEAKEMTQGTPQQQEQTKQPASMLQKLSTTQSAQLNQRPQIPQTLQQPRPSQQNPAAQTAPGIKPALNALAQKSPIALTPQKPALAAQTNVQQPAGTQTRPVLPIQTNTTPDRTTLNQAKATVSLTTASMPHPTGPLLSAQKPLGPGASPVQVKPSPPEPRQQTPQQMPKQTETMRPVGAPPAQKTELPSREQQPYQSIEQRLIQMASSQKPQNFARRDAVKKTVPIHELSRHIVHDATHHDRQDMSHLKGKPKPTSIKMHHTKDIHKKR